MNLDDYLACSSCRKATHKYEVFTAGLCLACYSQTEEANRPITARELSRMFGGK
jgi:hypothetical protein